MLLTFCKKYLDIKGHKMGNLDKILEYIKNNEVSSLTSDDWCKLLATYPQFSPKCNIFNNFTTQNWVDLISAQVQFATIFDKWDDLTESQMKDLLILYPSLYKKMDVRKIKSNKLIDLILVQPHLSEIKEINDNMDEEVWYNAIQEGQTEAAIYRLEWENFHSDKILDIMETLEVAQRCNTNFWVRALKENSDFINECKCLDKFSIEQWCNLLSHNSFFGEKCPILDKISIEQWVNIIVNNQYSAKYFTDWDKLTIEQWNNLFCFSFEEVYQNCNIWDKITDTKFWAKRISLDPSCADKHQYWNEFSSDDWIIILCKQPQFADKCCKWNEFSSNNWTLLLKYQTQFADREELTFEKICTFTEYNWHVLLKVIDDFEKIRANKGEELDWSYLVTTCPGYLEKCKKWDSFTAQDWSIVLIKYPELETKCDKWDEFSGSNWAELLRVRIQFFEKCDKWDEFFGSDWERFMQMQAEEYAPRFVKYWDKFNKNTQYWILLYCPKLKEYCNCWDKFSEDQWRELIKEYPEMQKEKEKLALIENSAFNSNVDSLSNNIIENVTIQIAKDTNNMESIDDLDNNNIPFDLPEITENCLSLSFSTLTKLSIKLQDKYNIKSFNSLYQFNLDDAENEDKNIIEDLKNKWQHGNWILSDLPCKSLINQNNPKDTNINIILTKINNANIIFTKLKKVNIKTIGDFLNFNDFDNTTLKQEDKETCKRFRDKCLKARLEEYSKKQRNYSNILESKKLACEIESENQNLLSTSTTQEALQQTIFPKSTSTSIDNQDDDNLPLDLPIEDITYRYLSLSFSTLTNISKELQDKYNIKSFMSLYQFNLDDTDNEDKELIEDLKNKWQHGNWILSYLPCELLVNKNYPRDTTSKILIKLKNANIKTIGDFLNFNNFHLTKLTLRDKEICGSFRDNCLRNGIIEFIEAQRKYMEKLRSQRLVIDDTNFDFPNISISWDYFSISFSTLTQISKELQNKYNIKSFTSLCQFNLDNAENEDKNIIKDLKNKWQHGNWILSDLPCKSLINQNAPKDTNINIILKKINNANIKTIGDFLNFNDFENTTLKPEDKETCKRFREICLEYGIEAYSEKQRNYSNTLAPKKLACEIERNIQKLLSASTTKEALQQILGDSFSKDYLDCYLDYYISKVIYGETLETIANRVTKTRSRIGQIVEQEIPTALQKITWWNTLCKTFFSKFGYISTNSALEAKGNELLDNDLGKVIVHYLSTVYQQLNIGTKLMVDPNIHSEKELECLKERIIAQLISQGCSEISKEDFLKKCSVIMEYFTELNLEKEYISNNSLWDILKPVGKGDTVKLQTPKEFIRQHNIIVEPTLRDDIIKMMRNKGYKGNIPKNYFAVSLNLAVHSQTGLKFKYILNEDLPKLSNELLNNIVTFIKNELETSYCVNLDQVCEIYQLYQVTPFMLKAILKNENALPDVIYSNTSTQIWKNDSEIQGVQGWLEKKLENAEYEISYKEIKKEANPKGYQDGVIANAINSSEKILSGGEFNSYYLLHIKKLKLDTETLSPICSTIEEKQMLSIEDIFNSHNQLCLDLGIKDARLLSSILKKNTPYYVDYPTVAFNKESSQTLIDMGLNFIKEEKWRTKEQIDKFYKEKSFNSQWLLLKNHPEIILIAENHVSHKEKIGWKEEYREVVKNLAKKALENSQKKYLKIGEFSYPYTYGNLKEQLPQLQYTSWNETLIRESLKNTEEFVVTGCNDSIFFIKEDSLNTFEDICLWIKKEEISPATDIIKYLTTQGIISDNWLNNKEFLETLRKEND